MYEIVKAEKLNPDVTRLEIKAPHIAKRAKAGQFVMITVDEHGERVPLTMADISPEKGTVTIVAQEVGKTTRHMGKLKAGDKVFSLVGPLGLPTELHKFGTIVCIGGGIGLALMYPVVKALKEAGNTTVNIIGARNEKLLIYEDEIKSVSDEFYLCTDDGSKGHKGFVSDILKKLIADGRKIDMVYAVGPIIMMKVIANITKPYGIKTIVSLNPIMVDGTGMCGSCRVIVKGETKFGCVDGPEFDGHDVDFENLTARNKRYLAEEQISLRRFMGGK
ncbi:MAG: sulfide/dihydroorotate dehydrogenase-like FAD/NAD-binding protein [Thermoplasmata archaeon]|jgi:ferredoxin--NADP+ reductase|nr:sulfide/dihydroorotate dehydrogenase-like FAD/NAD-binding protein [Thermoplasmata archaeon]